MLKFREEFEKFGFTVERVGESTRWGGSMIAYTDKHCVVLSPSTCNSFAVTVKGATFSGKDTDRVRNEICTTSDPGHTAEHIAGYYAGHYGKNHGGIPKILDLIPDSNGIWGVNLSFFEVCKWIEVNYPTPDKEIYPLTVIRDSCKNRRYIAFHCEPKDVPAGIDISGDESCEICYATGITAHEAIEELYTKLQNMPRDVYSIDDLQTDPSTLISVMEKHPNYAEWFNLTFPNGASSKEEVLSRL